MSYPGLYVRQMQVSLQRTVAHTEDLALPCLYVALRVPGIFFLREKVTGAGNSC